jgi:hypothetical protein
MLWHIFLKNGIKTSVVFDIEEKTLEYFMNKNRNLFEMERRHGWPFPYENEKELIEILNKNNQKCYFINSTYGLEGWILAEKMKSSIKVNWKNYFIKNIKTFFLRKVKNEIK